MRRWVRRRSRFISAVVNISIQLIDSTPRPLNPILGEQFTCYWELPDKSRAYYIAEQTSHHPPKSSYFYMEPHNHVRIDGTLKPRSRFLGNSAASMMEGVSLLTLMNKGKPGVGEK